MGEAGGAYVLSIHVTPLSLGTRTAGGIMTKLIKTIQCKTSETFTAYADNKPGDLMQIFKGETKKQKIIIY